MFARKKIGFRFIGNSSRINVKQVRIEGLRFPSCELFCVKDVSVIQNFKKKKNPVTGNKKIFINSKTE